MQKLNLLIGVILVTLQPVLLSAAHAPPHRFSCDGTLSSSTHRRAVNTSDNTQNIAAWLEKQKKVSIVKMLENISRADTVPGTVVAATTKENPNYYFHWVRDAALVMNTVLIANASPDLDRIMRDYVALSRHQQMTWTLSSWSGDPKFNPDGTAFNGPWGRPQIDGPPLRAITLIRWAQKLISRGETQYVREKLYDSKIPSESVIKGDLEYTAHHWHEPSFDLWEEVKGAHFYTLAVSMSALYQGADLAAQLGDSGAARFYRSEAEKILFLLKTRFIDATENTLITTVDQSEGLDYKTSGIDIAVVLALLHAPERKGFASESSRLAENSVKRLTEAFKHLYGINRQMQHLAPAIGRYPEDKYGGSDFNGGNPWVLTTFAMAEFYYKRAQELAAEGQEALAKLSIIRGDEYVARVKRHTPSDGSLSEQFSRDTGYMTSVENLTWSYASAITAALARDKAVGELK